MVIASRIELRLEVRGDAKARSSFAERAGSSLLAPDGCLAGPGPVSVPAWPHVPPPFR